MSLEEQQTFGGVTRQAGTLMICPELLDYVKSEVERDASLAKNLRKAREERELARRQGGKKKQGEDVPLMKGWAEEFGLLLLNSPCPVCMMMFASRGIFCLCFGW